MSFSNCFLSLDIYGKNPAMTIGGKSSMKTYFGSILSLLTYMLGLSLLSYFGLQFILKTNLRIVMSILSIVEPPPVYLSQKNFSFAIGLEDPTKNNNHYIDESIYTLSASLNIGIRNKSRNSSFDWKITPLDLNRCETSNFPVAYQSKFSSLVNEPMYCIKNISYALFGSYENDAYSYINFQIFQ